MDKTDIREVLNINMYKGKALFEGELVKPGRKKYLMAPVKRVEAIAAARVSGWEASGTLGVALSAVGALLKRHGVRRVDAAGFDRAAFEKVVASLGAPEA